MRKLLVIALVAVAVALWMGKQHMQRAPIDSNGNGHVTADLSKEGTGVVNVYSSRKEYLIKPLFDAFTKETGIEVKYLTDDAPKLIARLEQEAELTPADLLITVDVANLDLAKRKELLSEVKSDTLDAAVPSFFRDENRNWFGLSKRVRAIFYRKDAPNKLELQSYSDLTKPVFKSKLLLRSSKSVYNQSLIASVILHEGEEKAATWVQGMMRNIARAPQGNDTDQLRGIARGEGDLTIANSYYFARMLTSDDAKERALAEKIGILFPNQRSTGAHVNLSGAGVTRHAPHREDAIKLLEFLASETAQNIYAQINHEYPVNNAAKPSDVVASFGSFKPDNDAIRQLGNHTVRAVEIADQNGWR